MPFTRGLTVLTAAAILLAGAACGSDAPNEESLAAPTETTSATEEKATTTPPSTAAEQPTGLWNDTATAALEQAKRHFGANYFGGRIDPQAKRLTVSTFGTVGVGFPTEVDGVPVDHVVAERSPAEAAAIAEGLQAQASAAYAPAASPVGVSPHDLSGGVVVTVPRTPTQQDRALAESLVAQARSGGIAAELRVLEYDEVQFAIQRAPMW